VGRVITCDESSGILSNEGQSTVIVDKSNGRILRIVPSVPDDEGMEIIHFPSDSSLLPGFIDCHVHLTIGTDDYQMDHLRLSSADKSLRALKAAQGLLQAGFTTIRSAGDADKYYPSFAVAKSIDKGDFVGPRIVGAGHYISVTVANAHLL
jgi:imidazolonepropionase-like amidohydrolase